HGTNGLSTETLLKEILTPETRIEDVFKRVRLNVRRKTGGAQVPWESTSLEEDLWFMPAGHLEKVAEEGVGIEAGERRAGADAQRVAEAEAAKRAREESESAA